jgi:hypothetical protein
MRKRNLATYYFSAILLGLTSCTNEPELNDSSTIKNQVSESAQSNKNNLLSGLWIVRNLEIPDCQLCQENNMKLNKMWNHELQMKDTFQYKSNGRQRLAEKFLFRDSVLSLVGSDWSYMMDVRKHTPKTLMLAISQQYISEINSTEGPKYLIVTLQKD